MPEESIIAQHLQTSVLTFEQAIKIAYEQIMRTIRNPESGACTLFARLHEILPYHTAGDGGIEALFYAMIQGWIRDVVNEK